MGGVAILNPQDVLRDRFNYNHMPLISNYTSTNHSLKSRVRNPDFTPNSNPNPNSNSNPESVYNSNRRKRIPQKKTNDLPRIRLTKVSSSAKGLLRSMAKDGANFSRSKISNGPSLVMGKVTILKRGQALENDEEAGKIVALFDKEIKNEKKTVLFDEEIKSQKKTVVFDKENKSEKKTVLFDKEIKSEKVLVEKKNIQEKMGVLRKDEDVKRIENSKSVQTLLIRLGPESNVLAKFYAGSAFVDSPPPSSVPLPNFLAAETNDYESSNLRRLLKLDE